MSGAWTDLLRFLRRWWWLVAILAVCAIVLLVVGSLVDASDDEWSNMVTIATYGDGEKIQVKESILWAAGFLLFTLFSSFGSRGTTCKYKP